MLKREGFGYDVLVGRQLRAQLEEPLGTLRSRLGFVADNILLYVTGGFAYAQVETSYDLGLPGKDPAVSASASDNGWETGWIAGVGGEMSFGVFTVSAEYLFYDLGTRTLNPVDSGGIPQPTTISRRGSTSTGACSASAPFSR